MSEVAEPDVKRVKLAGDEEGQGTAETSKEAEKAPKEILLHELERLQKVLSNNLLEAKEHVRNSVEDFMEDKVRKLGPMIGHYFSTFQSLNVMTRNDMDRAVKKMYCFKSVRDAEEELFQAEQDWDSFLKEVEHTFDSLCGSVNDKELGSYGPCELKLTDVSTERQFSIQDLLTSASTVLVLLRHFA
ncbi:unnamed protein product [Porites lobata]|uniref:Uncharacterized protein n=1 Tax=Porites lobata TaxID=104759 RepID=A0ABN8NYG0_9CNID|nr:unnamed protein product [Porites lobata]